MVPSGGAGPPQGCGEAGSVPPCDGEALDGAHGFGPREVDRQDAAFEIGAQNLHALAEREAALKLPRGDAAIQEHALALARLLGLPAANDELAFLLRDLKLLA